MAVQLILLGTPNNNDGDSLYAGGSKINANFTELYTQLSGAVGNVLRIDLGSPLVDAPVTGDVLGWSVSKGQFIPSSSNMLRTGSGNGSSVLILTNNTGRAGVDEEYTGQANALELILNGRRIWDVRAASTGTVATTRGIWNIGMGNPQATSLSITTRGISVGGVDGLIVYRNNAEENNVSSTMLSTGSSGIILHGTPIINSANYRAGSDSSGAIIHSGFVQDAISRRGFANSTSNFVGVRGLFGGGTLAADRELTLDHRAFRRHIHGLAFNFRGSSRLIVHPGGATHYSFSTTGSTAISSTEVRAFVVAPAEIQREWSNTATWAADNTQACLDTIIADAWYYVYLVAEVNTGQADFVVTNSSSYAATEIKVQNANAQYRVIRRLGCFRTNENAITPFPFVSTVESDGTLRVMYTRLGLGVRHGSSMTTTSFSKTALVAGEASATGLITSSTATTATVTQFSSVLVKYVPPLPGITAEMNVIHNTAHVQMAVAFLGEPWVSSGAVSTSLENTAGLQFIRDSVANVTSMTTKTLSVSPGHDVISDALLAGSTIWAATSGTVFRYVVVNQGFGNTLVNVPNFLGWDIRSFTIAR